MAVEVPEISNEEFKNNIDDMTVSLMAVLQAHKAPLPVAIDSLIVVLVGAIGQIQSKEIRQSIKDFIVEAIDHLDSPNIADDIIDISDRIASLKN